MGNAEIRVLLVEDNPQEVKLIMEELHERQRITPVSVESVDRLSLALERLQKSRFDIILTDLKLPDSDGLETVKRLLERAPRIPVVVMTGAYMEEKLGVEALRLGAQDYLFKEKIDGALLGRVIRYSIERRQAQEEIHSARIKSDFISMVSHELRTPLTVVKESIEIIQRDIAGMMSPKQEKFLTIASRNIERLARLVNDVLDFQKLESKEMKIQLAENDINQLVSEVKDGFTLMAKVKGLELQTELEKDIPRIFCDRDRIIQVLTNFMSNAVKATEKGKITLKTKRLEKVVRVSVEDQGPGIKEEEFSKLFKAFGQLSTGNERKTDTTGLGLAISKLIIGSHKGKIGVESVYGKGATFFFILPIKERRNS